MAKKNKTLIFISPGLNLKCEKCGEIGPLVKMDFPVQFTWECPSCHRNTKFQLKGWAE